MTGVASRPFLKTWKVPRGSLSPSPPLSLFLSSHFLRRFLSQKHEQGDTQVVPHPWSEELMLEVGARGTCRSTIKGPRPSHSTAMDTSTRRWQICLVGLEPQLSLGPLTLSSTPTPTRLSPTAASPSTRHKVLKERASISTSVLDN